MSPVLPRRLRALSRQGQIRLTFLAGGLAVGAAAVLFAIIADAAQTAFEAMRQAVPLLPLLLTPVGFAVSSFVSRRWFPNSGGSGIPQAIAARALSDETQRRRLVSLRVAAGKMLLTAFGLLIGGSLGREGPTVQVGASVMYAVGHISPRRQRGLVLAGAAAGVAAAFNTPLAGIVFAIEEMSRSFETRTSGVVIATVIAAGAVSLSWVGNYTYFGHIVLSLHSLREWLAVPLCGVAGGLLGGLFSRIVIHAAGPWPFRAGRWLKAHPSLLAGACGLGVALCGLMAAGTVFGTGYSQALRLLDGGTPPPLGFGLLKLLATLLSAVTFIPGGLFSPSLAVGAGLGQELAAIAPLAPLPAMALLGMVGYFTGVVQAPITAFVIVTEMTDGHAMLVPVMLVALVASATSRLVCREGIYHALSHGFLPKAPHKVPPKAAS